MAFKSHAQRKAVMAKYRMYVKPDGCENYHPTNKFFRTKKEGDNFSYVETIAGMGEDYIIKKVRK